MAYKKTADLIADVQKSVSDLVDIVRGVAERVSALESKETPKEELKKEEPKKELTEESKTEPALDLPEEHKKLLHAVLNQKFGARVESVPDPTMFRFVIYVPKEYSSASDGHWSMYHEDARAKMVERASSEASIKQHIEKVFEGFDKSIQALIIAE